MRGIGFFIGVLVAAVAADSFALTEAGVHNLEADTHYRVTFTFHGTSATKGRIVNFNMPGFLLNSHTLSGATTCRFDRIVRTWGQEGREKVRAYFNTYGVTGPVTFDNLKVSKVLPRHRTKDGMELGDGERLNPRGVYIFRPDFTARAGMAQRPFHSARNGRFHDPQWRMRKDGEIVYRHEVKGRRFLSAKVTAGVSRAPSAWALDWSRDGRNWTELARYEKGSRAEVDMPKDAFPCDVFYIRIAGRGDKGFDLGSYSLKAKMDGDREARMFGDTSWIDAESGEEIPSGRMPQIAAKGALLECGEPDGVRIWTCDSGWKVLRDQDVPRSRAKGIAIRAAANETEAVQFVIRPDRAMPEPVIKTGNLNSAGGGTIPDTCIEILRVGYVFVDTPSDASSVQGWWPDPLFKPGVAADGLAAGENQPFWVRVKVPKGTAKGVYRGKISVSGICGKTIEIPLAVEVFGFELPDVMTCKTAFGFRPGTMRRILRLGRAEDTELFRSTVDRYVRCLADHHISVYDPQPWRSVKCTWTNPDDPAKAEPVFDWSEWDAKTERAFSVLHQNTLRVPHGGVLGGGTYEKRYHGKILKWKDGDSEYEGLLAKYLSAIDRHFVEKGWADKSYVYWFDEPRERDYAFVSNGMDRLKRYAPNLKRMITAGYAPAMRDGVNLWCPTTSSFHGEGEDVVRKRGDEMWWYVCCVPKSPYVTEFIDKVGTEMRVWLWQTWGEKSSGILIWETVYWAGSSYSKVQNPYLDPQCWCASLAWGNGDGRFLYPPPRCFDAEGRWIKDGPPVCDDPVETYRLEMLRDGIEDYEYFAILARMDPENPLLKVPKAVYSSMTEFTDDPAPIKEHRRRLAAAIEKLKAKSR